MQIHLPSTTLNAIYTFPVLVTGKESQELRAEILTLSPTEMVTGSGQIDKALTPKMGVNRCCRKGAKPVRVVRSLDKRDRTDCRVYSTIFCDDFEWNSLIRFTGIGADVREL
jgi:hypothetical protein